MNVENWKKWSAALRSGQYKQGHGMLCDTDRNMCCLGVACDISGVGEWKQTLRADDGTHVYSYLNSMGFLPQEVSEWLGIDYRIDGRNPTLGHYPSTYWNDNMEVSFEHIADIIDQKIQEYEERTGKQI